MNATWYEGARNLVFAIILLAVNDATMDIEAQSRWKREWAVGARRKARMWLASKRYGFMTFEWYCDLIGASPELIRSRI